MSGKSAAKGQRRISARAAKAKAKAKAKSKAAANADAEPGSRPSKKDKK